MILAAGLGTRLGELGKSNAKPLLEVNGKPVVVRLLERLRNAGVTRCVINLHHLGELIERAIGDGKKFGMEVGYSREPKLLNVAGGIANALPLLGGKPFIVVNADVCSDYDLGKLAETAKNFPPVAGHLVLGSNPAFRPDGDFALSDGLISCKDKGSGRSTYIGSSIYRPEMFMQIERGTAASMTRLWHQAIAQGKLSGELHTGWWIDVGTPERLIEAEAKCASLEN